MSRSHLEPGRPWRGQSGLIGQLYPVLYPTTAQSHPQELVLILLVAVLCSLCAMLPPAAGQGLERDPQAALGATEGFSSLQRIYAGSSRWKSAYKQLGKSTCRYVNCMAMHSIYHLPLNLSVVHASSDVLLKQFEWIVVQAGPARGSKPALHPL